MDGSDWSTAKLSTLLKNSIYVKADSDIFDYYERHGTQMITDLAMFKGEFGAQLYGQSKHKRDNPDWSDMKLVLLTHRRIVDSEIWLKCQRKLEKNKQITNSFSNSTSWLAGKIICEKCGHHMTTVKGVINKNGDVRRYFNCTGKSHQKICTVTKVTIYAEDLENMVYDCITEKLSELKEVKRGGKAFEYGEINDLKLKLKAVEQNEKQLMDTMLSGGFNSDLLVLANQKATQLKQDKIALTDRIEELKSRSEDTSAIVNLGRSWKAADYRRKKEVADILIEKIVISVDGDAKIVWNI